MSADIPYLPMTGKTPEELERDPEYAVLVAVAAVRIARVAHEAVFSYAKAAALFMEIGEIPEELEPLRFSLCGHLAMMRRGGA